MWRSAYYLFPVEEFRMKSISRGGIKPQDFSIFLLKEVYPPKETVILDFQICANLHLSQSSTLQINFTTC